MNIANLQLYNISMTGTSNFYKQFGFYNKQFV